MTIDTPAWVKGAVFYQIFPDRFRRGPVPHLPRGLTFKDWGAPAREQGFQGGPLWHRRKARLPAAVGYYRPVFESGVFLGVEPSLPYLRLYAGRSASWRRPSAPAIARRGTLARHESRS